MAERPAKYRQEIQQYWTKRMELAAELRSFWSLIPTTTARTIGEAARRPDDRKLIVLGSHVRGHSSCTLTTKQPRKVSYTVVLVTIVIPYLDRHGPLPIRKAPSNPLLRTASVTAALTLTLRNQANPPTSPSKILAQDQDPFQEAPFEDTAEEGGSFGGISNDFWNSLEAPPVEKPSLFDTIFPLDDPIDDPETSKWRLDPVDCYGYDITKGYDYNYVAPPIESPEFTEAQMASESFDNYREYFANICAKMMFVSGETAEPSPDTTWHIEEIVREQVIHMLKTAVELANRRGSKSINIHDLMFQIRHDKSKLSRLKTFLSWKDVRKNVKDSDDKGGGDADIDIDNENAQAPAAGGPAQKSNKKQKLVLPWDVESFYSVQVPERDDEEDEEEDEQNEATLARLASADERTRNMTREEYVYWSDCRQASFTFRKGKRFREWAGFGTIVDTKPNDDVIDILGFLTFEIVQTLTEAALKVKAEADSHNRRMTQGQGESKKRKHEGMGLFVMHEEGRTPVEPAHVARSVSSSADPAAEVLDVSEWTGWDAASLSAHLMG
ncbi:SAGA complex subunit spt3 [Cyphellophora attinorum]|uniref:SAGA complex subunit spt3 n=1 Tax=Cyphellophora attinorum TaxID=1664694 RepID=A0A0N1H9Z0_9EURO|nr:SAGA complex subunit spt3 [Phialophora attinorum]KPI40495.1 SAGA complex subunit spt3 [Phialophora attinorum]